MFSVYATVIQFRSVHFIVGKSFNDLTGLEMV
jgi:hypothetical protein